MAVYASNKSWRAVKRENEVGWLTVDAVLRAWKIGTRDSFGRACINGECKYSTHSTFAA
jgi:hypothetical protein